MIKDLKNMMESEEVCFSYRTKNGEFRNAKGTLNPDLIPKDQHPKDQRPSDMCFVYYDTNVNGWRSFYPINLIEIMY